VVSFDFDAAVRWARFDPPQRTLARRPDAELPFVGEDRIGGQALLLDTSVYIDQLQDRSPDLLDVLIATRQTSHSTVAIQELMHTVGVLDPKDPRSAAVIGTIRSLILSMPPHRIFAPDVDVLGRAALLSGILCRLQGYAADRKLRALQDCVLFLQAGKLGFTVLTANIGDFDVLLQLQPAGRALFYRRK
jgi:hypothetical protein